MANGRLEAQITIPSGGWACSVAITAVVGSPFVVTVPAGAYFPSDLLTTFDTQLDAATGADGAFTVTASTSESGTGLVTIAHATQTITVTWTSTDLRDALGFTGTLTPAALTFTGTSHIKGVWLPTYPINAPRGTDPGYTEVDRSSLVTPGGTVSSLVYNSRTRVDGVEWPIVERRRALITGETTPGESFERWMRDTHYGELSYFVTSPQVRLYWDASAGTYHTFYLLVDPTTNLVRAGDGQWIGIWRVALSGYRVPGT